MLTLTQTTPRPTDSDAQPSTVTGPSAQASNDPWEFAMAEGVTAIEALAYLLGLLEPEGEPARRRDIEA